MRLLAAFVSGVLFSVGLVIGGMTRPENIIGFLDFFGDWKPALAFVMLGAVGVYAVFFPIVLKRRVPLFASAFDLPDVSGLDSRLFIGATAFGVGWGIGGFCPGPALVALGAGAPEAVIFAGALAAGVVLHRYAFPAGTPGAESRTACG